MITVQNVSRRLLTIQLDAIPFRTMAAPYGYAIAHVTTVGQANNGQLVADRRPRALPSALTLLAGEVRTGLPNEVLQCTDVKNAVSARSLRIVAQDSEPLPTPAPPPTEPPDPPPPLPPVLAGDTAPKAKRSKETT